jgi:AraC-like DNA-binding protein
MPETNTDFKPMGLMQVMGELALTGRLSLARVARRLGTSPRTLQRRLSDQGLTFQSLVDRVRLYAAKALLCQTDLAVQDVAHRLGYCTPSSFARAFVRWTGTAPRAFRRGAGSAGTIRSRGAIWVV